ncbi:hypothetical protein ACFFIS_17630 [Virgibacillus soli]|uniref:hypothetical protein n=1 Tax=Paracerasibacillus soli TaxID=480284 RepID=UPI0035E5F299
MGKRVQSIVFFILNILASVGTLYMVFILLAFSAMSGSSQTSKVWSLLVIGAVPILIEAIKWIGFYYVVHRRSLGWVIPLFMYGLMAIWIAQHFGIFSLPVLLAVLYNLFTLLYLISNKRYLEASRHLKQTDMPVQAKRQRLSQKIKNKATSHLYGFMFCFIAILCYTLQSLLNLLEFLPSIFVLILMSLTAYFIIDLFIVVFSWYALWRVWQDAKSKWKYLYLFLIVKSLYVLFIQMSIVIKESHVMSDVFRYPSIWVNIATIICLIVGITLLYKQSKKTG